MPELRAAHPWWQRVRIVRTSSQPPVARDWAKTVNEPIISAQMHQMRFNCTGAGEIDSRLGSICTEEFQNNEAAVARRARTA
jgi:hypothetical protein